MNFVNLSAGLIAVLFAVPAAADTGAWLDRCLLQSKVNKQKSKREALDVTGVSCAATALDICQFDADPKTCFGTLTSDLEARAATLMASFPASIEDTNASDFKKKSYARLLKEHKNPSVYPECPLALVPFQCEAFKAAMAFGSALSILDYIAFVYEEVEEKK
ncbi:MAG: hypothetical protein ABJL67_24325 [Sulfitobacter sp.]